MASSHDQHSPVMQGLQVGLDADFTHRTPTPEHLCHIIHHKAGLSCLPAHLIPSMHLPAHACPITLPLLMLLPSNTGTPASFLASLSTTVAKISSGAKSLSASDAATPRCCCCCGRCAVGLTACGSYQRASSEPCSSLLLFF